MSRLKVLLRTPVNAYTGYGRDGIGIARAMLRWGCDVYLEPTYVSPPIPAEVAQLMTKHLRAPFDLMIQHADPDNLNISQTAAACSDVKVMWSMWEFSQPRPLSRRLSTFAKRSAHVDLFLMYDNVALEAWQPYGHKKLAWGVLQGGYDSGEYKYFGDRDWFGERFAFIMHGQLHNRKCPYTAIQAFNELKYEHKDEFAGARLGLHTTIGDPLVMFGELIPGMKVYHEMWEKEQLEAFYRGGHVLLAPSRGEGKNLPALEFMTTGGTCAVTNWGGHTMWLSPEYAYPLDYDLTPTMVEHPDQAQDAKVSVQHLKDVMWHIYTHRAEAKEKAELAALVIPQMCDWDVVLERFWDRVRDLVPGKGEKLWVKAQETRTEAEWASR
jgi:glycosyltransferase involved in cell wall biosynthesis